MSDLEAHDPSTATVRVGDDVDNSLTFEENTRMLFGNVRKSVEAIPAVLGLQGPAPGSEVRRSHRL